MRGQEEVLKQAFNSWFQFPFVAFWQFNYSNNEIFVLSHSLISQFIYQSFGSWGNLHGFGLKLTEIFFNTRQNVNLFNIYHSINFNLLFVYTFFTTSSRIKKAFVPSTAHVTKPPNLSFILNLMIPGWEEKQEKMESCPWKTWCLCQGNRVNRGRRRRYEISVKGM